jgi:hypothetical protein
LLEIELSMTVTPLGAVARLEHALSNFEGERETYRHLILASASRPTARASTRLAFDAELALKRSELATIEADLAASSETAMRKAAKRPDVTHDKRRSVIGRSRRAVYL